MQAKFLQGKCGSAFDYTPSSDVAVGSVVVRGDMVTVSHRAISAGTLGATYRGLIYRVEKPASETWTDGVKLYWDESESEFTLTDTGNKLAGYVVGSFAGADTEAIAYIGA